MAKTIPLTHGYYALVDDFDFDRVSAYKWHALVRRRKDGMIVCVYATRKEWIPSSKTYKSVYMHRFILGLGLGRKPEVDHEDSNGLNNQRSNLRAATRSEQLANTRLRIDSTSAHKGVSWDRKNKKWKSQVVLNGKYKHLGRYDNIEDASRAHDDALKNYFGDFAKESIPCVEYAQVNSGVI